ncbi:DUF547 domain-containing protein [Maricaulis salignorans]|uniref:DUF547 domain-containing protein n=1 Tax=Maricaulis salignorans TaxID=144026 RepID=UPI003A92EC93
MLRILSCVFIPALLLGAASAQTAATPASLEQFQAYDPESTQVLNFEAWSEILNDIVLRVPASRRQVARGRPQQTGTAIYRGNTSRYRYEGNRVIYHLMDDGYEEAIREFRIAMEDLPNRVDFGSLNSDQQLAYWFNLYNAAVIEQVIGRYPESRINRTRAIGTNQSLFEAKILNVAGVPLSLDDIRLRIVYPQWDDPRVIYGFHNGSIGGPNIRREAFRGTQVWRQLDSNATDFVNSLRGVELSDTELRVSQIYGEARPLFPDFETDLRAHLTRFANDNTARQLEGNRPVATDVVEWHIADMTNGVTGCTGSGSPVEVSGTSNPNVVNLASMNCNILPQTGLVLLQYVFEQRLRLIRENALGTVDTIDIETPSEQPVINMTPSFGGAREETPEG